MSTMTMVWIALMVVFLIVEGATAGLASIWFALGALVALAGERLHAPLWLQITLFIVASVAALLVTRPLARKYVNAKIQPTNADMVIGVEARVTERIDNIEGTGAVSAGGKIWTARSATGDSIEKDSLIIVRKIEGVKLIVEPQHVLRTIQQ